MSAHATVHPTRQLVKPILSDDPVLEADRGEGSVFYTSSARRIARHMGLIIAAGAGSCLAASWGVGLFGGPPPLRNLFLLLAFTIAGVPALTEVWGKLRAFRIDIDLLMVLGAGLAAYVGSPFEGALLLFLFALSGGLEAYAVRRTQRAIVALRKLAPTEATVIDGDRFERVSLRQVAVGARILIKPGEKVPLDGVVAAGRSSLNESAITGESMPRDRTVGDSVFAGTHNLDGRLEVRVTKLAADTTLSKIVEMVTQARRHPATAQRLIDRIGPAYSVVVIVAAIAVALGSGPLLDLTVRESILRGIALLIVASPCALIIATPVVYLSAIAGAARQGVLIKGGAHLEVIARAKTFAFDKTGTLTTGRVHLVNIDFPNGIEDTEALRLAGAIEAASTHPLALAVEDTLRERGINPPTVTNYRNVPGEGATGVVEGRRVWVGRPETAGEHAPQGVNSQWSDRVKQFRGEGKTVAAVVVDGAVGLLAFQDTTRPQAAACVTQLRKQGIKTIEMLTGDHAIVARQVAERLRLDGYKAQLRPEDKVAATKALRDRGSTLVLVGDGINDAPALAQADAGVAMGSIGADVAMEAADVVLMKDRIDAVAWLHRHALRTAGIVRQNLTFAIAVIVVLSVFAVLGRIPLPLAVIGHEGSTVLVALNALRLLKPRALDS